MSLAEKTPRHELVVLFRLVSQIRKSIVVWRSRFAYGAGATHFLDRVVQAADATLRCLSKDEPQEDILDLLSGFWLCVHSVVKPLADGNILSTPFALVRLMEDQLRQLPEFEEAEILVGITEELNYLHHNILSLEEQLGNIRPVVKGFPEFPASNCFVSLPYSKAGQLFGNCILYHELGHFVFQQRGFSPLVYATFTVKLEEKLGEYVDKWDDDELDWLTNIATCWLEELFADCFAVKIIGPAYMFPCAELLFLFGRAGGTDNGDMLVQFDETHPASRMRLEQQLSALKDSKWILPADCQSTSLGSREAQQTVLNILDALTTNEEVSYEPPEGFPKLGEILINVLVNEIALVGKLLMVALGDEYEQRVISLRRDFLRSRDDIIAYLSHAIVPSAMCSQDKYADDLPDPVSFLNSGLLFWLSDMGTLYKNLDREDHSPLDMKDRALMESRAEAWTAKAIEDSYLIGRREDKG